MTGLPSPPQPGDGDAASRASAARNASVLTAATIAARLSTFALAVVMGRELGADSYGRYGLAAAIATIVVPVADLGLTAYVIREAARRQDGVGTLVRSAARIKLLTSLVTMALSLAIVVPLVDDPELAAAIVLMMAATLAEGAARFAFGYFQGRERMDFEAASTTLTSLIRSVAGIGLVVALDTLIPVLVWITITALWQGWRAWRRMHGDLRPEQLAGASTDIEWRAVGAMGLVTVFAMVYMRADSVILGAVESERLVGLYTGAYTIMAALQIVPWMTAVALGPVFARTHRDDPEAFRRTWQRGLRAVLLIALPSALVVCVLATPVVSRLYGEAFADAGEPLAILVWSSPVWACNMVLSGAIRGAGRELWLTVLTGAGATLNIAFNLWAIPRYGMEGAAAVTVATEGAVLLGLGWLAIRRGVLALPRLPLLRMALALVALALVAEALSGIGVVLALPSALLAYVLVLLATRVVSTRDLDGMRARVLTR